LGSNGEKTHKSKGQGRTKGKHSPLGTCGVDLWALGLEIFAPSLLHLPFSPLSLSNLFPFLLFSLPKLLTSTGVV